MSKLGLSWRSSLRVYVLLCEIVVIDGNIKINGWNESVSLYYDDWY